MGQYGSSLSPAHIIGRRVSLCSSPAKRIQEDIEHSLFYLLSSLQIIILKERKKNNFISFIPSKVLLFK